MEMLIGFLIQRHSFVDGKSIPEAKACLSESQDSVAWWEQEEERAAVHKKRWARFQDPS